MKFKLVNGSTKYCLFFNACILNVFTCLIEWIMTYQERNHDILYKFSSFFSPALSVPIPCGNFGNSEGNLLLRNFFQLRNFQKKKRWTLLQLLRIFSCCFLLECCCLFNSMQLICFLLTSQKISNYQKKILTRQNCAVHF